MSPSQHSRDRSGAAQWLTLPRSISVAQTRPVKGDVEANLDEHLRLTEVAKAEGAQVVVFPELSLTAMKSSLPASWRFRSTIHV